MSTADPQSAHPPRRWLRPAIVVLLLALLLAVLAWRARPDGNLHIFFLHAPGDAVLIQSPRGSYVLIDGGADPMALALHLGQRMPFWQRSLAAVVLTQGDEQRVPGQVAALARYRAQMALAPPGITRSAVTEEWLRLLEAQGTPIHAAQAGERLALDGATLTVLAAGPAAEAGLVLRLDYGATSVLFNGAGSELDDAALQASAQPVTVLAYPWQRDLHTPLLTVWQPQAIVFTTAYESSHPAQLTFYERAIGSGSFTHNLYHPELDGTIELVSDGRAACIRSEDDPPCVLADGEAR